MCMAVIFDTLLLIIQSMCCVSCYVNAKIGYKKSFNFMSSVTNKMKTCRTQHYHIIKLSNTLCNQAKTQGKLVIFLLHGAIHLFYFSNRKGNSKHIGLHRK